MKYNINLDTFLISDSHFGHKAVMKKEPSRKEALKRSPFRVFEDLSVYEWNTVVNRGDKVLHLGDLYFDDGYKYLAKLSGDKILLVGNNDIGKFWRVQEMEEWQVCKKLKLQIPHKSKILRRLIEKFGKEQVKNIYANAIVLDIGKERIMFSHFPVMNRKSNDRFWEARDVLDEAYRLSECSLNIHGHTHSKKTHNKFCINVSCEETEFRPVRLSQVLSMR